MTNNTKYISIFAIVACMGFAGCEDDLFGGRNNTPAEVGDEIVFGGSLRSEESSKDKTRTVYGDKNSNGTEIKWYAGDKVRIFCSEANSVNGSNFADYAVDDALSTTESPTNGTSEDYHNSSLTLASDEAYGLQWGSQDDHNFYGVYPSPDMLYVEGSETQSQAYTALSFNTETKTLTGFLPNSQEPLSYRKNAAKDAATGAVTYTMYPAMRYAYMLAHQTANPSTGKVSLTFHPIVTAVEITIENTMKATSSTGQTQNQTLADISMVGVESDNALSGSFTTVIAPSTTNGGKPTFTNTNNSTDAVYKSIAIPVQSAAQVSGTGTSTTLTEGTNNVPVTLRAGDKLKFTVFMLPTTDLSSLRVKIMIGSTVKTATLNSSNMKDFKITAQKKNFITNIPLGYDRPITTSESNWISALPDATEFNRLSIPGAGGVGSHVLNETTYGGYMEQTLSIEDLWDRGVRCFEFGVDKIKDNTLGASSNENLGNSPILANGYSTGVNLSSAITEITDLIRANPREFAVVIISYQPSSNSAEGNYGRSSAYWAEEFNRYWNEVIDSYTGTAKDPITGKDIKLGVSMLKSTTTVGEARGKLFCISRPTAIGGDPWWYSLRINPDSVVSVAGWGPMPDQWYARGYIKGNRPYNITKDASNAKLADTKGGTNYLYPIYSDATPYANYTVAEYGSKENKFLYNVYINPGDGSEIEDNPYRTDIKVYAQEWRRVCGTPGGFTHTLKKTASNTGIWSTVTVEQNFTYHWAYSYDEKKDDVVEAFEKAIADDGTSGTIYINSLCGYYIDSNYELSYQNQRHRVRFYAGKDNDTGILDDTQVNLNASKSGGTGGIVTASVYSYNDFGGTQGNIKDFADDINEYFYDYIKSVGANNISGATGIILMDRIAKEADKATNPAGYYLPQIILNNNFRTSTAATALNLPTAEYNGEPVAAPARRGANGESEEMSITWE